MDEFLKEFIKRGQAARTAQQMVDEGYAEEMGYDCGKNGANERNSHFSIFHSKEMTAAWELGKKRAEQEKSA